MTTDDKYNAILRARRNNKKIEMIELQRKSDVIAIGDLHGEHQAMEDNLRSLDLIDDAGNWSGDNKVVVFHGDILADRGTTSLKTIEDIDMLRDQARANG